MNRNVEPHRPDGVNPASYIAVLSEHNGTICEICDEEQHTVPQLTLPVVRFNSRGSAFCTHIYTPSRCACFYWNSDGTTFVRRVDGSGEFTFAHGWVKCYRRGSFEPPDDMPYVTTAMVGRGQQRVLCEAYYEALFRRHHPQARWMLR